GWSTPPATSTTGTARVGRGCRAAPPTSGWAPTARPGSPESTAWEEDSASGTGRELHGRRYPAAPCESPSARAATPGASTPSAASGSLGPYGYSGITNSNGYNTYVGNNMWAANSGTTQTACAANPGNWSVVANAGPNGYTGVQTYPDVQQLFSDWTGSGWNGG